MEVKATIETECPEVWDLLSNPLFLQVTAAGFQDDGISKTMTGIIANYLSACARSAHMSVVRRCSNRDMLTCFEEVLNEAVLPNLADLRQFAEKINHKDLLAGTYVPQFLRAVRVTKMAKECYRRNISLGIENESTRLDQRMLCGITCDPLVSNQLLNDPKVFNFEVPDLEEKRMILREHLCDLLGQALQNRDKSMLLKVLVICMEGKDGAAKAVTMMLKNKSISFENNVLSPRDVCVIGWAVALVGKLKELNLGSCGLDTKLLQCFLRKVESCKLQVKKFCAANNSHLDGDGMRCLGILTKDFGVVFLDITGCDLTGEHLEGFESGNRGKKFAGLDASKNKRMGEAGMAVIGKLIESEGCLTLTHCSPNDLDIQGLHKGLGDTLVKRITLEDSWNEPIWVEWLLEILPQVSHEINLRGWKITESEEEEIVHKLQEIYKKGRRPTVVIGDRYLKADGVGSSSQGHHAQSNSSEEVKKETLAAELDRPVVVTDTYLSGSRLMKPNLDELELTDSQKEHIRDALEGIFKQMSLPVDGHSLEEAAAKGSVEVASTNQLGSPSPSCSGFSKKQRESESKPRVIMVTNNIQNLNAMKANFGSWTTVSHNESSVLNAHNQQKEGEK